MKKNSFKEKKDSKNIWQIQEAKAKFSQLINDANKKGYQTITKQGEAVAVILSKKEFDKITSKKNSLINFFKEAPCPEIDLTIERSKDSARDIDL